ncbi:hypothetical protein FNV43_RR11218 [Rhamnella rubrinervis]|uniref:Uncharacterized protein n=1 Tax=Rhamnella rubrinervis TaxID=2594499 RepID=A0A8K0H5V8_9ROSA|nr:hypothetical protein FNV43_RR11218 [Rhamnella rubrinervis]
MPLLTNEALERLASQGLQPNMVLYLTQEFGLQAVGAATAINLWSAATNFMPVIGAFVADSYTGRFPMIAFGSVVSLLGMILLWVTTIDIPHENLFAAEVTAQTYHLPKEAHPIFYTCYQIDKRGISTNSDANNSTDNIANNSTDNNVNNSTENNVNNSTENNVNNSTDNNANNSALRKFFIWYYVAYTVSLLLGASFVVYIQERYGWKVGFGIPVLFMLLSAILFLLASRIYIKYKVSKNLIAGLVQVIVASFRNRSIKLSSSGMTQIHYYIEGSSMSRPTENLRCLNKACIIKDSQQNLTPNGTDVDPWSVCTVDQVEELKSLIRIMPIWSTAIFMSVMMSQAAIVEMTRRNIAIKEGYSDNPQAVVHMSAMWLVPQSMLMGFAEAFNFIAQIEFFYAELPRSMSSIASCLFTLGMSAGNLVASLIVNIVNDVTKRGNGVSWVATNINKGHYDYYCWLLAGLSFANLVYFGVCHKAYGPCRAERIKHSTLEDGVLSRES